jgi:hypothetical protein
MNCWTGNGLVGAGKIGLGGGLAAGKLGLCAGAALVGTAVASDSEAPTSEPTKGKGLATHAGHLH